MADKKYHWLKMSKDFFDQHEIKIIEAAGKDYVLLYIKLLCESVSHNGELRFSEKIPYSREMLASVTNMNIDAVEAGLDLFIDLGLVEVDEDGTFYMTHVTTMIGSASASENAIRQQRYRDRKKEQKKEENNAEKTASVTKSNANVTASVTNDNESIEYRDKSKSKEIDKSILSKNDAFSDEFEVLWKRYPRKEGKKDALRHYIASRKKGVKYETISDGLNRYLEYIKKQKIKTQYIKIGSSWFCEHRWDDEYKTDDDQQETFAERLARL